MFGKCLTRERIMLAVTALHAETVQILNRRKKIEGYMLGKHKAMTHTIGMVTAMKTKPHSDKKQEAE